MDIKTREELMKLKLIELLGLHDKISLYPLIGQDMKNVVEYQELLTEVITLKGEDKIQ